MINIVIFADGKAKSSDVFRLIDKSGDGVTSGEKGLLLYEGGTVCGVDGFSDNSANAICREMGYTQAMDWTARNEGFNDTLARGFGITLSAVFCRGPDWRSCRYSTTRNSYDCLYHSNDVYLTCSGKYAQ